MTAIVGASGSGKTMLVKLLLGFYEPNRGCIRVGGTPLPMVNPHVWRAKCGSVVLVERFFLPLKKVFRGGM